jgi:hypothetical protein
VLKNFGSPARKTFFDSIDPKATSAGQICCDAQQVPWSDAVRDRL